MDTLIAAIVSASVSLMVGLYLNRLASYRR